MRALILAAAVLVLSGFWVLPVMDPSEARYAEVAREMAAGGNWLVPHVMGEPHLTKPPLTYWVSAAAIAVFGPQAWAARLPVAIAFVLTVVLTADLGRRLWTDPRARQGAWAGWALLFMGLPLGASNILTTDTLLCLFETAAVWCAIRSLTGPESGAWRTVMGWPWALGFHASLGLAVLTKGPPALLVLLPLCVFVPLGWGTYPFRRLLSPAGLLVFAAVALPWFLLVEQARPGTLAYWWTSETIERIAGEKHRELDRWLFAAILLAGTLPAGVLLPRAGRELFSAARKGEPDRAPGMFAVLWAVLPAAVFFIPRSRLPLYFLPVFPALALIAGRSLALRFGEAPVRPRTWAVIASVSVVAIALRLLAPLAAEVHLSHGHILFSDPRPPARAIRADAGAQGARPQIFATARFSSIPAFGLAFYVEAPVGLLSIDEAPEEEEDEEETTPLLAMVLGEEHCPGVVQYFAVRPDQAPLFEERVKEARGQWIHRKGGLWIWRREAAAAPVAGPHP